MVVSALVVITGGLDSMVALGIRVDVHNEVLIPVTQISVNLLTTAGWCGSYFYLERVDRD